MASLATLCMSGILSVASIPANAAESAIFSSSLSTGTAVVQVAETSPSAEITDVGDPTLAADADLSIIVTVTNPTSSTITVTETDLAGQNWTPNSRSALLNFLEGSSEYLTPLNTDSTTYDVPGGGSIEIPIHIAHDDLRWNVSSSEWGPRGIEANLTLSDGTILTDRSLVVLEPSYDLEPMATGVVVPLTLTSQELSAEPELSDLLETAFPTDEASADTATTETTIDHDNASLYASGSSRISEMLSSLAIPGVTVALDPGLLSSTDTATAARAFAATNATELLLTPWADADVQNLVATGATDVLTQAYAATNAAARAAQLPVTSTTALLTPDADQSTVSALASQGVTGFIVSGESVAPTGYRFYTPTARFDAELTSETTATIAALATDSTASSALAGVLVDDGETAATSDESMQLSALDSRQTVLALSAVTYRERPNDSRATLLAADREGVLSYGTTSLAEASSDAALTITHLSDTISALMSAPWVTPATATDLLATDPGTEERSPLAEQTDSEPALTAGQISEITESNQSISLVAGLSSNPYAVTDPAQAVTSQLYATAWRGNAQARASKIQALADTASFFTSSLQVMPSSTIRVVSEETELPVHVTNTLPFDVGVTLKLESRDVRLQAQKVVAVTIPAGSSARVMVPVTAKGSGNIKIEAEILTPSGTQIGAAQSIEIRVRADWENIGTLSVAILMALVLLFGIVRSLRKGRRSPSVEPAAFKRERHARLGKAAR